MKKSSAQISLDDGKTISKSKQHGMRALRRGKLKSFHILPNLDMDDMIKRSVSLSEAM